MSLEIPIVYEVIDDEISPDCQFSGPGSAGSGSKIDMLDMDNKRVSHTPSITLIKRYAGRVNVGRANVESKKRTAKKTTRISSPIGLFDTVEQWRTTQSY